MAKKMSFSKNAAYRGVMALAVSILWSTTAFADVAAFQQCTNVKVVEILNIIVITTVVSLLFEHILGELVFGERAPRFKTVLSSIGKKFVPWVGAAIVLIELVPLLQNCVPLL